MIYWFWGYPGVGKDYVAKKFSELTSALYINGDSLLTDTERERIIAGTFTKENRLKKLERISKYLHSLTGDVAITDSLPDMGSREFLLQSFEKDIVFIRVESSVSKHRDQIENREGHFFTSAMLDNYIENNWEDAGKFAHTTFKNEDKTEEETRKELLEIYNKFSKQT